MSDINDICKPYLKFSKTDLFNIQKQIFTMKYIDFLSEMF